MASSPQHAIWKLDHEHSDKSLTSLFADVCVLLAYRQDVTPHEVLRRSLAAFGWPESEWPKVREQVAGWLAEPSALSLRIDQGVPLESQVCGDWNPHSVHRWLDGEMHRLCPGVAEPDDDRGSDA